jgi:hypothetical protein
MQCGNGCAEAILLTAGVDALMLFGIASSVMQNRSTQWARLAQVKAVASVRCVQEQPYERKSRARTRKQVQPHAFVTVYDDLDVGSWWEDQTQRSRRHHERCEEVFIKLLAQSHLARSNLESLHQNRQL